MSVSAAEQTDMRPLPRSLAGATVMQIARSLRSEEDVRASIEVARALVLAGARAIVAGEDGPLVAELRSFGGEWFPFTDAAIHPATLRRNTEILDRLFGAQRVDIVHTHTVGGARAATVAAVNKSMRVVLDLPELSALRMRAVAPVLGAFSRADRIVSPSLYMSRPVMDRYDIPRQRVAVIPRTVDTDRFDPTKVQPEQIAAMRQLWGIPHAVRVVLVPGQLSPWKGQMTLVKAARILTEGGVQNVSFVFAGDDRVYRVYVNHMIRRARREGVYPLFRFVGHCDDMPAAYAAADLVVVPRIVPPLHATVVAEAQVMGRPVIASSVGALPEGLLVPPVIPDDMSTGWLVPRRDPPALADALAHALALGAAEYRGFATRARDFGRFMFSLGHAAQATLDIYRSLLKAEA